MRDHRLILEVVARVGGRVHVVMLASGEMHMTHALTEVQWFDIRRSRSAIPWEIIDPGDTF